MVSVVPPSVGDEILAQAKALSITRVWFQPGAESDNLMMHAKRLGITTNDPGTCIMVARRLIVDK